MGDSALDTSTSYRTAGSIDNRQATTYGQGAATSSGYSNSSTPSNPNYHHPSNTASFVQASTSKYGGQYPDHGYNNQQQQQQPASTQTQHSQDTTTFQTPRPPRQNVPYDSHTAPTAGNAGDASFSSNFNDEYRNSGSSNGQYSSYPSHVNTADNMASNQSQQHAYPHQSSHPHADNNYQQSDTPLIPQRTSTTQQEQPSIASSSNTNLNHESNSQNVAYQYGAAHPQRTVSGGFDTVKAGPPSPGSKMDLLPFSHSHHQSSSSSSQHPQQQSSSSRTEDANASSSHRHRSNRSSNHHSNSQSQSFQSYNSKAQRPNSQIAQTPTAPVTEQPYHEPVAPSSGRSANSKGSSTTSEFTKRKNWSQRIVEEMQDILHVLAPDGTVLFVSPSVTELCGLTPEEMVGRPITEFMENNDVEHFEQEFRKSIMTESSLITYFRLKKTGASRNQSRMGMNSSFTGSRAGGMPNLKEEDSDDSAHHPQNDMSLSNAAAEAVAAINLHSDSLLLEVTGKPYYTTTDGAKQKRGDRRRDRGYDSEGRMDADEDDEAQNEAVKESTSSSSGNSDPNSKSRNSRRTVKTCKCFFAMARPYPSRNNATLDTFLELKIENEKLRMKLADIYREIEGGDETSTGNNNTVGAGQDYSGMGVTHADDGSEFQLRNANNQPPKAYFGADPLAVETNRERQISGFPNRIAGSSQNLHALQQQQGQNAANGGYANSRQDYEKDQGQYAYQQRRSDGQHDTQMHNAGGMRGGPIDSGDGLISSAGLIPSTSNTYGALGIGISAAARAAVVNHQDDNATHNNQSSNDAHQHSHHGVAGHYAASASAAATSSAAAAAAAEDKKKKMKKQRTDEGEFVCRDCGTVDSPEWRRGPLGPKTLCNACGLRWAKKNKQQQRNSIGGIENILTAK